MQQRALPADQNSRNVADAGDSRRFLSVARVLGLTGAMAIGFMAGFGCGADPDTTGESDLAALKACGLDDGTVEHSAHLHACDPGNQKKTTICHIPPGNPANAHTLCVGNAAVPAHLSNHGDYLGACQNETPCTPPPPPPPPQTGSAGAPGSDGQGGGSVPATGGSGGPSGAGGFVIIVG